MNEDVEDVTRKRELMNRRCVSAKRPGMMVLTAVLAVAGCTTNTAGSTDLTWHQFPRYERVRGACSVILESGVSSHITEATIPLMRYRLHFGESLRANLPQALSKLFDEVNFVTQAESEKTLPATAVLLTIAEMRVVVRPPVTTYSEASADVTVSGEIVTNEMDHPLKWQVRGGARSISDHGWPEEILDGSIEQALNELTRYISTSSIKVSSE